MANIIDTLNFSKFSYVDIATEFKFNEVSESYFFKLSDGASSKDYQDYLAAQQFLANNPSWDISDYHETDNNFRATVFGNQAEGVSVIGFKGSEGFFDGFLKDYAGVEDWLGANAENLLMTPAMQRQANDAF